MAGVGWRGRFIYILSADQPGARLTLRNLTVVTSILGSDWSDQQGRRSLYLSQTFWSLKSREEKLCVYYLVFRFLCFLKVSTLFHLTPLIGQSIRGRGLMTAFRLVKVTVWMNVQWFAKEWAGASSWGSWFKTARQDSDWSVEQSGRGFVYPERLDGGEDFLLVASKGHAHSEQVSMKTDRKLKKNPENKQFVCNGNIFTWRNDNWLKFHSFCISLKILLYICFSLSTHADKTFPCVLAGRQLITDTVT